MKTIKCINSFLDSDVKKRVKNKLCFILCQDKAFEDKMNCLFLKKLVKVIVLIANVYLSTCGSFSSVQ